MFHQKEQWQNLRQSANQFRGSVGGGSLPFRVGVSVFMLVLLVPLVLIGLFALVVAVFGSLVVVVFQHLIRFFSDLFSSSDGQGRRNVKVIRRG